MGKKRIDGENARDVVLLQELVEVDSALERIDVFRRPNLRTHVEIVSAKFRGKHFERFYPSRSTVGKVMSLLY